MNEHLDHRRNRDAAARSELLFSMIDYIAQYSQYLDGRRYQEMLQQGDVRTFWDETGRQRETMLSAWRRRWNHWGGHGAHDLRSSSSETNWTIIRCRKKVEYKGQLASEFAWMPEQNKLPSPASLKDLAFLVLEDHLWFVHRHDCWCWKGHLEL